MFVANLNWTRQWHLHVEHITVPEVRYENGSLGIEVMAHRDGAKSDGRVFAGGGSGGMRAI